MGQPTYMYRLKDGAVEARIFDSDAIPEGWVDAPPQPDPVEPKAIHRGRGKYDVFDADGRQVADNLVKDEAHALVERLTHDHGE